MRSRDNVAIVRVTQTRPAGRWEGRGAAGAWAIGAPAIGARSAPRAQSRSMGQAPASTPPHPGLVDQSSSGLMTEGKGGRRERSGGAGEKGKGETEEGSRKREEKTRKETGKRNKGGGEKEREGEKFKKMQKERVGEGDIRNRKEKIEGRKETGWKGTKMGKEKKTKRKEKGERRGGGKRKTDTTGCPESLLKEQEFTLFHRGKQLQTLQSQQSSVITPGALLNYGFESWGWGKGDT